MESCFCSRKNFVILWLSIVLSLLVPFAGQLEAAKLPPVWISWNKDTKTKIAGYIITYGTKSGKLQTAVHAGRNTKFPIYHLKAGETYYFAVRAYDRLGRFSPPSKEISYRGTAPESPRGWISEPSTGGTIVQGQSIDFSASGKDPDGNGKLSYRWSFGDGSGIPSSREKNPGKVRFDIPGTYTVSLTVIDPQGLMDVSPDTRVITVVSNWKLVKKSGWKLKYVNSEQPDGFAAEQAFDGNPKTFWHTQWKASAKPAPPPPHQIQIDLRNARTVKGFKYLPRQDGYDVGMIGKYAFYVSMDGSNWGSAVATGKFTTSTAERLVFSTPKRGRFIRLVSFGEPNGADSCAIAELDIIEGPSSNHRPSASAGSVSTGRNKPVKFTLKGKDRDENPISFKITSKPKHGKLGGNPPNLTYTPDKGYSGIDSFTFLIHDGKVKSKTATFKIRVGSAKSAPMEIAAAGIPSATAASTKPVVSTEIIGGLKYLTLTAPKPALATRVQVSPNLTDWFSGANHVTIVSDNERFLKVRDNTPLAPGKKRYIRLKKPSR